MAASGGVGKLELCHLMTEYDGSLTVGFVSMTPDVAQQILSNPSGY